MEAISIVCGSFLLHCLSVLGSQAAISFLFPFTFYERSRGWRIGCSIQKTLTCKTYILLLKIMNAVIQVLR
jgi:hypothetical protein